MGFYKYQTEGKTTQKLKEKANQKVEAEIVLAPNVSYNVQDIYTVQGVGVFSGDYRVNKITKRIDTEGMTVTVSTNML